MFHKPLDREHPASGGDCRYSRIRQWTAEVWQAGGGLPATG